MHDRQLTARLQNLLLPLVQSLKPLEKAFILISIVFGLLFLVLIPPFNVPDEPFHFLRAYQVSEGKIIATRQGEIVGGRMPKSILSTAALWLDPAFHPEKRVKKTALQESLNIPLKAHSKEFIGFHATAVYSPVPYIPAAIAFLVGRVLNLPPIILLYLGRLCNLFAATLITFLAIKQLPEFQRLFFLLALTPMALSQRTSLSADSILNAIAFLFIASIVNYAFNPKIERLKQRDIIFLSSLGVLLSLCKSVYFLVPLLSFIIPSRKLGSGKQFWVANGSIFLSGFLVLIGWSMLTKPLKLPLHPTLTTVSVSGQAHFLLAHPFKIFVLAWNELDDLDYLVQQFIGKLGWLDTSIPDITRISYIIILTIVALTSSYSALKISMRDRLKIFGVLSSTVFLIYLIIYLTWDPVGSLEPEGVQGRYFTPLSPLFFLLFYNSFFSINLSEKQQNSAITYYSCFALTSTLVALLYRYYGIGIKGSTVF